MTDLIHRWITGILFVSLYSEIIGTQARVFVQRKLDLTSASPDTQMLFSDTGNRNNKNDENVLSEIDVTLNDLNGNQTLSSVATSQKLNYTHEYKVPKIWSDFCEAVEGEIYESEFTPKINLTTIKCTLDINHSNIWTMTDLRESMDILKDMNIYFSVEIKCHSLTHISLSFPFKVRNLIILKVEGCRISDYFADNKSNVSEMIPDSLRVVQILDTTITILQSKQIGFVMNKKPRTKERLCLQANSIEVITMRNITYDIITDNVSELHEEEIGNHNWIFHRNSRRISDVCDYLHLQFLDRSIRTNPSFDHMHLLTDRSIYERVLIYNASNTGMKELNDRYLQWSQTFPNLQLLDLSKNNISKLYRFAYPLYLKNRSEVTTIDLKGNRITTITVNDLDRFKDMPMVFFDLRNNPIDCNCSDTLEELLNYIKQGKHLQISNLSDYSYIENLECNNPENLKGTTLIALTSEMICESKVQTEYLLVPIICLSASIVILALLLFMALRFRHEITIILFTRFNIIIPCQTRDSYDSEKKYDAFVSYSSNEEEYIEKLFEDLEKPADDKSRPSFKFCMHHRDFVPGKTIFDNVTFSVESSRHTIILLSNHFLKSEYCLYEFQEAFRQSIMEKRRHLVIIMMEDIPEEKLPRDLRRCIKTFTYIRKNDFLFTERLVFALSIKHKGKTMKKVLKSDTMV